MSVLKMESWMSFKPTAALISDASMTAERTALQAAMEGLGYAYYTQAISQNGFVVRPDPVAPARRAITIANSVAQNRLVSAFRFRLGAQAGDTVIGGFSIFVPPGWKPTDQYPYVTGLLFTLGPFTSQWPALQDTTSPQYEEMFRVRFDGTIARGSDRQSGRVFASGKQAFLEYRITPSEFRVWIDDILVLQQSVAMNYEAMTIAVMNWGDYGQPNGYAGESGAWAFSNFYVLREDADMPNVRLGPSTRVIGVLPKDDVFAQFKRPSNFPSNANTAAQPFVPNSPATLKTDTVGAQDIYAGADDEDTATAALVHAVSVKVIAQNLDSAPHTMKPLIVSNGTAGGQAKLLPAAFGQIASVSAVDPDTGLPWTSDAAAESQFGMKLET